MFFEVISSNHVPGSRVGKVFGQSHVIFIKSLLSYGFITHAFGDLGTEPYIVVNKLYVGLEA